MIEMNSVDYMQEGRQISAHMPLNVILYAAVAKGEILNIRMRR